MTKQARIFAVMLFSFMTMVLLAIPVTVSAQVTVIQVPSGGDLQAAIDQAAGIVNGVWSKNSNGLK